MKIERTAQDDAFNRWWQSDGQYFDPDTSDVPLIDKLPAISEHAFDAGVAYGMAVAGNYTADDAVEPTAFTFANGTVVSVKDGVLHLTRPEARP